MLFVFCCYGFYFYQKIDPEVKLWLLIKADLILVGALERKNVTSMREFWLHTRLPVTLGIRGFSHAVLRLRVL